jgi:subtilisin family serine protease
MQRRLCALSLAVAGVLVVAAAQASEAVISKAQPALLRALESGQPEIRVIVGIKDGTPSMRTLREQPDPSAEADRRVVRVTAQKRVAAEMPSAQFHSAHFYESFSMMAGVASAAGIETLARRSDVSWIAVDEKNSLFQSAGPQAAQQLIRSDAANAAGFTGKGQVVAVVDTGVDQSIPELGGGGFPNAKVIGGVNVTEPNSPPYDCVGHGTSVASIVASSLGVAPDAKIVAIKVFHGCDEFAFDSVILDGLNFAATHQSQFGIGALNMSLGGSATGDNSDLGFCDQIKPQYAGPIDALTAAGVVVTVASGNAGTKNQISSPACVSSAVSVGAVYPLSNSFVNWGLCTDTAITPGTPTCFSNGASSLSLLAPGAFWNVPTTGGAIESFSGTSAAAPAVAGAVALVRQARPGLSPSNTVSLLRATGRPIQDPRNNVVTPLIDTLRAVQAAPSATSNFDGAPIPIPAGGSATATTTVSGFTGYLSNVEAWVSIDHSNPGQLLVNLTGPDSTTVVLHNATGKPEQPINTIFGSSGASLFSMKAFQGKPANGTWTLTVQDLVAGTSGRILHFSITPVAGLPQPPVEQIPLFADGLVLPIVAHTQGTKLFTTDARIYNPNLIPEEVDLYFVGNEQTGATAFKTTHTIPPGQVLDFNDIVSSEFGQASSFGQVTIVSNDPTFHNFLAQSRTSTQNTNGTFGFSAPGLRTTSGLILGSGTATTNGLLKTPTVHTNVGFTETSGFPVTVRIDVRDRFGTLIGSTSRTTQPYTTYLITDILLDRGIPSMTNFRVDFTVVSPQGRAIPFATTVDKFTGDSAFHAPIMPVSTKDDIIVTQSSFLGGANGDFFETTLDITNVDTKAAFVTVNLLPLMIPPGSIMAKGYLIQPGQTLEFPNVLSTEFDLDAPVAAGFRIHPTAAAKLAVSSTTSVTKFGGTFGYTVDGVRSSKAVVAGGMATSIFLDQTFAAAGSRASFGFVEVTGNDVQVAVGAFDGATGNPLGNNSYSVPAYTSFQTSVTDLIGTAAAAKNFYVMFSVVSGNGAIVPWASSSNNTSGDVTYIAGQ